MILINYLTLCTAFLFEMISIKSIDIEYSTEYFPYWLTHLSMASFLWDIGKQYSPRCDTTERGVPSEAILFA